MKKQTNSSFLLEINKEFWIFPLLGTAPMFILSPLVLKGYKLVFT